MTAPDENALFTEESARQILPGDGARIFKDHFNGRWLGFSRGMTRSRSWQHRSDFTAMSMV
eukprot:5339482-Lingulodinium_polyedra.AAC.1